MSVTRTPSAETAAKASIIEIQIELPVESICGETWPPRKDRLFDMTVEELQQLAAAIATLEPRKAMDTIVAHIVKSEHRRDAIG